MAAARGPPGVQRAISTSSASAPARKASIRADVVGRPSVIGLDGEGFQRVGDGDEGLCRRRRGRRRRRWRPPRQRAAGRRASDVHRAMPSIRLAGAMGVMRAGADGFADGFRRLALAAQRADRGEVGVEQPGRRSIGVAMADQGRAGFEHTRQMAGVRLRPGFRPLVSPATLTRGHLGAPVANRPHDGVLRPWLHTGICRSSKGFRRAGPINTRAPYSRRRSHAYLTEFLAEPRC